MLKVVALVAVVWAKILAKLAVVLLCLAVVWAALARPGLAAVALVAQ